MSWNEFALNLAFVLAWFIVITLAGFLAAGLVKLWEWWSGR
jgi:hypothetical protein